MRVLMIGILALVPGMALAQAPDAKAFRVEGVIAKISPSALTIKDSTGAERVFELAPKMLVLKNRSISLRDIQAKDFVASAAVRAADGKLHSTELRVFPDALRGLGEGQRPMNDERNQTMTNATVTGTAVVNGSNTIKVTFAGGQSELILDPGVPVTRIEQVPTDAIKPGQRVRVQGKGTSASRITIQ